MVSSSGTRHGKSLENIYMKLHQNITSCFSKRIDPFSQRNLPSTALLCSSESADFRQVLCELRCLHVEAAHARYKLLLNQHFGPFAAVLLGTGDRFTTVWFAGFLARPYVLVFARSVNTVPF